MAMAAYNVLADQAVYVYGASLAGKLRSSVADNSVQQIVADYSTAPILMIDDLGTENVSEFIRASLDEIVNARYRPITKPLLITTNSAATELAAAYPRIESRIHDREISQIFALTSGDYRKHDDGQPATTQTKVQVTGARPAS